MCVCVCAVRQLRSFMIPSTKLFLVPRPYMLPQIYIALP